MLFIYCAGSLGKEIYDLALRTKYEANDILFVDDSKSDSFFTLDKIKVISNRDLLEIYSNKDKIIIANGEPAIREKIYNNLSNKGLFFDTLIDTTTIVSPSAKIGEGSVICDFCSISSEAIINNNVLVNRQSIVGHDIVIGKNSVISSTVNLGGSVKVGKGAYIAMGAHVREGLTIGDFSIVSMGSVVHRDVPDDIIVMGNPARPILKNKDRKVFN